jgi:hypothetical protein
MILRFPLLLALAAVGPLAACSDPNTVLFVTNSSLGVNFDSKPPTANIAYDRVEGFIGPRYENGAAPPAVASIQTDGKLFNPQVRQTYATGGAAVGATEGKVPDDAPQTMQGHTDQKKLMYFGTATTFGLKIGFSATSGAPLPDSFLFGYRRKEASVIPVAEMPAADKPGQVTAVYPSVLASIEVNIQSAPADPANTGMNSTQYFATGRAAEALSKNPKVQAAFQVKAEKAMLAGLSDIDKAKAEQIAATELKSTNDQMNAVIAYLTKAGSFQTRLNDLVAKAGVSPKVKNATTADELRTNLRGLPGTIQALYNATLG